jgi:hypothetical protein
MIDNSNPYEKPIHRAVAIIAALILVVLGTFSPFAGLSFQPESGDSALSVLGRLVLIALFVERGIEVFVELWRGASKNKKKNDIKTLNEEKGRIKGNLEEEKRIQNKIDKLSEDLHFYQAITARISLWTGFMFGLLVSISGVRALNSLMTSPIGDTQGMLFQGVDIVLTAALISGGSEGIHKIMTVYKSFMEGSEKRIKERER